MLEKINNKDAVIGIIGLGYVGIPLALRFADEGFKVIGFDVNQNQVERLNKGQSPFKHIDDKTVTAMVATGFKATGNYSCIDQVDAIIICVPTPLKSGNEPDLSYIEGTLETMRPFLRAGQVLSLESTTWPGTTREIIQPFLQDAGFTIGENFYLIFSPEREDPGNENFTVRTIPKVVGGITPKCLAIGQAIYGAIVDQVVPVSSTDVAEMVKLLENIHRSVNIGLVNELKIVTDRMGLNIFEIVKAAATKPFGFTPYYPGPGVGGHCIPIDPFYLTWKAHQFGVHTRFIELAGEINSGMPKYVVSKLIEGLNAQGKAIKASKILALGIAYKSDVDDVRESPSVEVMELVREWGGDIQYSDPNVPTFPTMRKHQFDLTSCALTPEKIRSFDAVILLTRHKGVDYDMIEKHARLIIDTRGNFDASQDKVVPA